MVSTKKNEDAQSIHHFMIMHKPKEKESMSLMEHKWKVVPALMKVKTSSIMKKQTLKKDDFNLNL